MNSSLFFLPQFHNDLVSAVNACYEGDRIVICPGHYLVEGMLHIADSIEIEGKSFYILEMLFSFSFKKCQ